MHSACKLPNIRTLEMYNVIFIREAWHSPSSLSQDNFCHQKRLKTCLEFPISHFSGSDSLLPSTTTTRFLAQGSVISSQFKKWTFFHIFLLQGVTSHFQKNSGASQAIFWELFLFLRGGKDESVRAELIWKWPRPLSSRWPITSSETALLNFVFGWLLVCF